jgi:dTDP-4-dehydrorhamnose reductase
LPRNLVTRIQLKMNKPTILITGANGLLGQKLVERLVERGSFDILATGRGRCRLPREWRGYTYTQMDITDQDQINEVFAQHHPAIAIHCASMTHVDQCETDREACFSQNVEAVDFMVKACELYDTHFIHLSTDFIFDGKNGPYDELDAPNPINFYGLTKLEAENIVRASSGDWAIVRTGLVYGISYDMSRSNIVLWVKNALESGKELTLVTDQYRTPTLAEDLAEGCILIAEQRATGVYNISGNDYLTPYDMAKETASFFKLDASKIKKADSNQFSQVAKRPLRTGFIIDKAIEDLGYSPHSYKEGIEILAKQINYSLNV